MEATKLLTCVCCGEELTLEMEQDSGVCVDCQAEAAEAAPEPLSREERADEDRWEEADRQYDLAREDAL